MYLLDGNTLLQYSSLYVVVIHGSYLVGTDTGRPGDRLGQRYERAQRLFWRLHLHPSASICICICIGTAQGRSTAGSCSEDAQGSMRPVYYGMADGGEWDDATEAANLSFVRLLA